LEKTIFFPFLDCQNVALTEKEEKKKEKQKNRKRKKT
jgi:hypothetical protein